MADAEAVESMSRSAVFLPRAARQEAREHAAQDLPTPPCKT